MKVMDAVVGAAIRKALSGEIEDLDIEKLVGKLTVGDMRAIGKIVRLAMAECGIDIVETDAAASTAH